jgi:hypothetical protein
MNTRSEANARKMRRGPPKSASRIAERIPQNCDGHLEAALERRVGNAAAFSALIPRVLGLTLVQGTRCWENIAKQEIASNPEGER